MAGAMEWTRSGIWARSNTGWTGIVSGLIPMPTAATTRVVLTSRWAAATAVAGSLVESTTTSRNRAPPRALTPPAAFTSWTAISTAFLLNAPTSACDPVSGAKRAMATSPGAGIPPRASAIAATVASHRTFILSPPPRSWKPAMGSTAPRTTPLNLSRRALRRCGDAVDGAQAAEVEGPRGGEVGVRFDHIEGLQDDRIHGARGKERDDRAPAAPRHVARQREDSRHPAGLDVGRPEPHAASVPPHPQDDPAGGAREGDVGRRVRGPGPRALKPVGEAEGGRTPAGGCGDDRGLPCDRLGVPPEGPQGGKRPGSSHHGDLGPREGTPRPDGGRARSPRIPSRKLPSRGDGAQPRRGEDPGPQGRREDHRAARGVLGPQLEAEPRPGHHPSRGRRHEEPPQARHHGHGHGCRKRTATHHEGASPRPAAGHHRRAGSHRHQVGDRGHFYWVREGRRVPLAVHADDG